MRPRAVRRILIGLRLRLHENTYVLRKIRDKQTKNGCFLHTFRRHYIAYTPLKKTKKEKIRFT